MISFLPGRSMTRERNRTLSAYVMGCSGRGLPALLGPNGLRLRFSLPNQSTVCRHQATYRDALTACVRPTLCRRVLTVLWGRSAVPTADWECVFASLVGASRPHLFIEGARPCAWG
jgi:hypothetical protein